MKIHFTSQKIIEHVFIIFVLHLKYCIWTLKKCDALEQLGKHTVEADRQYTLCVLTVNHLNLPILWHP